MATVISNARSEFVKNVIKTYTDNRVGQYSKYLDTDPIYVTYYSINMVHSRADLGTDAIQDVLGSNSPIRFNRIDGLPIYFKGGLEPDTVFEDGLISNEIEINDITILPNTVTPRPYDHILIQLPNMVPLLLRVNGYRNMTIQSNDFFSASAHAIAFGDNITDNIEKLVVERYKCIFDNIGTQNSCFIRNDMFDTAVNLNSAIEEMKTLYNSLYYNEETNSYIYNESFYTNPQLIDPTIDMRQREFRYMPYPVHPAFHSGMFPALIADPKNRKRFRCFMKPNANIMTQTVYDMYMTKFIMDSGLFYNESNFDSTSAIVYEDMEPLMFEYDFKRTLWYAVMTKNTALLADNYYYVLVPIRKQYSALMLSRFPKPSSVLLIKNTSGSCCDFNEYFSHELIKDIKNKRQESDPTTCKCNIDDNRAYINVKSIIDNPDKDFNVESVSLTDYDVESTNDSTNEMTEEEKNIKMLNDIIYNYFYDIETTFDVNSLLSALIQPSMSMFEYFPIILYILKAKYDGLFEQLT